MSAHFLRTSAEKQGEADARVDERAENLIARRNRLLLLNQEYQELAKRPVLSLHVSLDGRCA